jgi:hypothetical protein
MEAPFGFRVGLEAKGPFRERRASSSLQADAPRADRRILAWLREGVKR